MSNRSEVSGIADASRPNAGRMYDYFLGGNHNFEVDRHAAEQVTEIAPEVPRFLRVIRWFLGESIRRLCDEGYTKFIDFASGLPTMDHIHQVAPEGTKVLYSDIDAVTVTYAREIIGDNPNVRYMECDAGSPEDILHSETAKELFGDDRDLAIGFNGIAWFLPEERVSHALQTLYDWSGENAKLYICEGDLNNVNEEMEKIIKIYEDIGEPFYFRQKEKFYEVIGSWNVADPGLLPLQEWLGVEEMMEERIQGSLGAIGAILEKEQ